MKTTYFKNSFGDTLYGNAWEIASPKALVLIVTGMCEHSGRYNDFATFLNNNGYSALCIDHYGQGVGKNGPLGRAAYNYFDKFMKTIDEIILKYKKDHRNLPVYIFAHSMGSFVTQGYIENYHNADKVVLCGSNHIGISGKLGYFLARIIVHKFNRDKDAKFLDNLAVGGFAKSVKDGKFKSAWISYNENNCRTYDEDPFSGYKVSNGFYLEFFKGLSKLNKSSNLNNISKDLPIYIIAGDSDPVGKNGKGPRKLDLMYKKHGLNSRITIYPKMRHEILNENERKIVYQNVLDFFNE